MKFLFSMIFLCICTTPILMALPAQVIVIRHAEKNPDTRQLESEMGQERAGALAYYLTETEFLLNFGPPDVIFSSRSVPKSDRLVPRTIQTMMPLANLLELPIHSSFNGYQVNEMANLVLNNKKYDGKNVVICWNHSSIHDLINAFGYQVPFNCSATQKKYPDCRFDLVFVMTYPVREPFPYATVYLQQLMFGDLICEEICPPSGQYPPSPLPPNPCSCNAPGQPVCDLICDTMCSNVGMGDN